MTGVRIRLFLTCWLVYSLHFATDVAREHYLVMSIVEDHSYALDKYYGLHVDIFQNPPEAKVQGAHHGANPGISMLAAVPYFLTRPAVEWVVGRDLERRAGDDTAAVYRDDRPRRVEFYQRARREGLDLRFGLVAAITLVLFMAPLTAGSAVMMFSALGALGLAQRAALWLSLLYAFGTPVFFRAAYLNQNMAIGVFAFAAFLLIWNPRRMVRWSPRTRLVAAGLLGGLSFLSDYSGAVVAGLLGLYAWWRQADDRGVASGFRDSLWYGAGLLPGVLMLWQYQWASFGNPFLPPQNWMAPVKWIDVGYQGVGGITPELLKMLLVDPRFGLFVAMPLALLALPGPWLARRARGLLPQRETLVCLGISAALVLFFSTVQYTRLQWVTGIRYLAPLFPFLFLAAVPLLLRLPRIVAWVVGLGSVLIGWSLAMVRNQGTVLDNVQHFLLEGFQLPWLTVLGKLSTQYAPWLQGRPSALPWLALTGVALALIWRVRNPWERIGGNP
ncbi:MAG: hypothetical protein R2909_19990 [Gemmatimonadales bacterium]